MRKLLLIPLVLLLVGCPGGEKETVKIGALIPLTGGLASYGEYMQYAIDVAVEEINENGGVLGKEVEVVVKNTETNPDVAGEAAQELVDEGIRIIIGAAASSSTIEASEVTIPNECVLIAPPSTSPDITTLDDNDLVFRTCPSDLFQGKVMAKYLHDQGKTSIVALYINNSYGIGLKNVLYQEFAALGGETLKSVSYPEEFSILPPESIDFLPYIDTLYARNADVVVLIAYDEGGIAVHKEAEERDDVIEWFGCDGIMTQGFLDNAGTYAEGIKGTAPYHEEDEYYDDFRERYSEKAGCDPITFIPNTYDAVILAALAIEHAGTWEDGIAIRDALREVASGGTAVRTFADAVEKLQAGEDIDYNGISGTLDFDENGDVEAPYEIWEVQSGEFVHVEVVTP